jgi:hypothetical protein
MPAKPRAGPGPGETTTDQLLERGLQAAADWEQAPYGPEGRTAREAAAEAASSAMVTLDARLREGGPLPASWAR